MREKIWNLLPLLPLQESVILLRGWLHGCPSPTVREYCICKHSLSSESGTVIALPVRRRQVTEPNYSPKVISPSLLSNTNLRSGHLSAQRSQAEGQRKKFSPTTISSIAKWDGKMLKILITNPWECLQSIRGLRQSKNCSWQTLIWMNIEGCVAGWDSFQTERLLQVIDSSTWGQKHSRHSQLRQFG